MATTYVDLVTDTGELIRIECPSKHEDALYESLENAMKRGDWWAPRRFEGCGAQYLGLNMERVSMRRIVGML